MSLCCRAQTCETMFKPKTARKNLQRYRRKGLTPIERQMVATIPAEALHGARVLEIGGGIGAMQAELLASGAREGEVVELVEAYEPYARELVEEKGLNDRSRFRVADILEQPDAAAPAAVVVMNRVVCCSPDGIRLAEAGARLAQRMLVICFPRDRFLVRAAMGAVNLAQRIARRPFRVFIHPKASLRSAAEAQGLSLVAHGQNVAWEFMALGRQPRSS